MKCHRITLSLMAAALGGAALVFFPSQARLGTAADYGPEPSCYWHSPEETRCHDWCSHGWNREMALLESGFSTNAEHEETAQVEEAAARNDEYRYEYGYEYAYPEERYGNNESPNETDQENNSHEEDAFQTTVNETDDVRAEDEYAHDEEEYAYEEDEYAYDGYTYDYTDAEYEDNPDDDDYEPYADSESYEPCNRSEYGEDYDYEDAYALDDEWSEGEYEDRYGYEYEDSRGYEDEYEDEYEDMEQSYPVSETTDDAQTGESENREVETNKAADTEDYWYYDEADYGMVDADDEDDSFSEYSEAEYYGNSAAERDDYDYANTYEYYGKGYYEDEFEDEEEVGEDGSGSSSRGLEPRVELLGSEPEDLLTTADQNLLRALARCSETSSAMARATYNDYLETLGMEATDFRARFETASDMEVVSFVDDAAAAAAFLGSFRLIEQGEVDIDEAVEILRQNLLGLSEQWILGISAITAQSETQTTSSGRPVFNALLSVAVESLDRIGDTCQTLARQLNALRETKTAEIPSATTRR